MRKTEKDDSSTADETDELNTSDKSSDESSRTDHYTNQCNQCGKTLSNKRKLRHHEETHLDRSKRQKWSCRECDKAFLCKGYLASHIQTIHRKKKPYTCSQCNYSCANRFRLDLHVQTHLNHDSRQKYPCKECNKSFLSPASLRGHIISVHRKQFVCHWQDCRFAGKNPSNLRYHVQAVNEKLYRFPCPATMKNKDEHCPKKFKVKGSAMIHYKQVHLKMSVPCTACDKSFLNPTYARLHFRRVHEGDSARWRDAHTAGNFSQLIISC